MRYHVLPTAFYWWATTSNYFLLIISLSILCSNKHSLAARMAIWHAAAPIKSVGSIQSTQPARSNESVQPPSVQPPLISLFVTLLKRSRPSSSSCPRLHYCYTAQLIYHTFERTTSTQHTQHSYTSISIHCIYTNRKSKVSKRIVHHVWQLGW